VLDHGIMSFGRGLTSLLAAAAAASAGYAEFAAASGCTRSTPKNTCKE